MTPKLRSLTDIYNFLRDNRTPFYMVTPCAYNLLGIDQWIGNFEYITYFDSFDGLHPRVFKPNDSVLHDFASMEEIANTLLANPATIAHIRARGPAGRVMFVMFDSETEALVHGLGLQMALPSAALRTHIDSKITTTRLANEAGVQSVPNALGRAST